MLHLILQNIEVFGEKVEKLISDINILIYLLDKNVRERSEDIEAKKELMDKRAEVVKQLYQLKCPLLSFQCLLFCHPST